MAAYPGFASALERLRLTAADGAMLAALASHQGRQELFLRRRPEAYESLEASSQDWHDHQHDPLPWCRYFWGVLLRGYREFEQRIDALADLRQSEGLAMPRAGKRQLVREACLRQLLPFPVSSIEQECPAISRELIRQVLQQLADEGLMQLEGRGRARVARDGI